MCFSSESTLLRRTADGQNGPSKMVRITFAYGYPDSEAGKICANHLCLSHRVWLLPCLELHLFTLPTKLTFNLRVLITINIYESPVAKHQGRKDINQNAGTEQK